MSSSGEFRFLLHADVLNDLCVKIKKKIKTLAKSEGETSSQKCAVLFTLFEQKLKHSFVENIYEIESTLFGKRALCTRYCSTIDHSEVNPLPELGSFTW